MSSIRLWILTLLFIAFGAALGLRLFLIQVQRFPFYKTQAKEAFSSQARTPTRRGDIFFQDKQRNKHLVATTKPFLRLFIDPRKVQTGSEDRIADALSQARGIPKETILERLQRKDDPYEPLQERIAFEERDKLRILIQSLPPGVGIEEYEDRFYPYESFASHVLGFVGFNSDKRQGLYGVEKQYDAILSPPQSLPETRGEGFKGIFSFAADAFREEQTDGASVILTLDISIQSETEKILSELIRKWKSPRGSIVVMRPDDGAILAMASAPSFNLNRYREIKDSVLFLNPVVQNVFEPGSIMKLITIATGIEQGSITPETTYVDTGVVERSGYAIRNAGSRTFGKRTVKEVLMYSINTGAIFVAEQVGAKAFLRSLESFGLGAKTGVDLPGEVSGDITNLDSAKPVDLATASFGQGVSATPIQMIRGINAIANGGVLVTPHVVEDILYPDGRVSTPSSRAALEAVSSQTAAKLSAMMVEVVKGGYSKKAEIPGYAVAGKTGTAQVPGPEGGYSDQTVHSFVGFAPAFNPAFIILMKLDEPLGVRFASDSITPSFSRLAQFILRYYGIPPGS